jgi:1,4-alpha-glucan branching enzyme
VKTILTDQDVYLFKEGTHSRLYDKLGAHADGTGTRFAVWAPNAAAVSVIGDFNDWSKDAHPLTPRADGSGIWERMIPEAGLGALYKYHIVSNHGGYRVDKRDPFAFYCEIPPATGAIVCHLDYDWSDAQWMAQRGRANALDAPWSIYELHPGSWRRVPDQGNRFLTWRELAPLLVEHMLATGFTHVELMPVMEHPFYGSWGYQTTGYFAPTARYGTPQDFMFFVDYLHRRGIGVILDWVPSHFPNDEHGLAYFDGTHLFEHADPKQGYHPEWHSCVFNYGRNEVRAFLTSSALFWLEHYHVDGIRVDAVASMLYLDYGRTAGQWIPNRFGGHENLEAIGFIRQLNESVYREFPDVQTIAEESTAWPQVSRPTYLGGLGFGMKWNMGWMHDTLEYFANDPIHRKYHHDRLTFSLWYAFYENFVLPLSHDEVVYGKRALLGKMPGDDWRKFANLRALYGYMWGHPGKKLLFMGGEFGQWDEWQHEKSLDWHLLQYPNHQRLQRWIGDLNRLYRGEPALHRQDFSNEGFEWMDCSDWEQSIITFVRRTGGNEADTVLVVCNFTPVMRNNYRVGVPHGGFWKELLNSDAAEYGGSGQGNLGGAEAAPQPFGSQAHSLALTLPPLSVMFFKGAGDAA